MKRVAVITLCFFLICVRFGAGIAIAQQAQQTYESGAIGQAEVQSAPISTVRVQFEVVAVLSAEFQKRFNTSTLMQFSSELIPLTFVLSEDDRQAVQRWRTRDALRTVWQQTVETETEHSVDLLLGGEFPVPVGTYDYVAQRPASTVQFKEYGVSLKLRAVDAGHNKLAVELAPEVSTVNLAQQIRFADYVIPALDSRRTTKKLTVAPGKIIATSNLLSQDELSALSRVGSGTSQHTAFAELVRFSREAAQPVELLLFVTLLPTERRYAEAQEEAAETRDSSESSPFAEPEIPTSIIGESGFATSIEKPKVP